VKPIELNDPSPRMHAVFARPLKPQEGLFHLPTAPGLGLELVESEVAARRREIA
jgi:L-alanine-DL-glutamate epimerase-like enolase superfamily enzyme